MILPIIAYGDPVLKKPCKEVPEDYANLQQIIDDMFETMYNAGGVGLAASQVGHSIRLFIVDSSNVEDEEIKKSKDIKQIFINPVILNTGGKEFPYEEGCLSIPKVREDIIRPEKTVIQYYDQSFKLHKEKHNGINARIILHEYDHLDGKLFTDHLIPLKKQLLKKQLSGISKGVVEVSYRMRFPLLKKKRS